MMKNSEAESKDMYHNPDAPPGCFPPELDFSTPRLIRNRDGPPGMYKFQSENNMKVYLSEYDFVVDCSIVLDAIKNGEDLSVFVRNSSSEESDSESDSCDDGEVRVVDTNDKGVKRKNDHSSDEWETTDIEVIIRDTHEDDELCGQTGIIRGISAGMCSVFLPREDRVVNILGEHLQPVVPEQLNMVKVILGDDRESTGKLLSIDDNNGVVQLSSGDIRMIQLSYLCKMK